MIFTMIRPGLGRYGAQPAKERRTQRFMKQFGSTTQSSTGISDVGTMWASSRFMHRADGNWIVGGRRRQGWQIVADDFGVGVAHYCKLR